MSSPTEPPPDLQKVVVDSRVEWVDTDSAGHHHNSAIMRWVEAAEADMMSRLGLPSYFPEAPRVYQSINFTTKLVFGQAVRTHLWIDRIGSTSLAFGFEVEGWDDSSRRSPASAWVSASHGRLVTAHVTPGDTSTSPWPDSWRSALRRYVIPESDPELEGEGEVE